MINLYLLGFIKLRKVLKSSFKISITDINIKIISSTMNISIWWILPRLSLHWFTYLFFTPQISTSFRPWPSSPPKGKALLPLNEKTPTNRERQKLRMARAESDRPRCQARYEAARNSKIEMIHQYKSDMWRTASAWWCLRWIRFDDTSLPGHHSATHFATPFPISMLPPLWQMIRMRSYSPDFGVDLRF